MTMTAADFERAIVRKLGFKTRHDANLLAWLEHEGKVVVRTKRPHGTGVIPFAHHIRLQLKLDEDEFRRLIECTLSREDYIAILRRKGWISPTSADSDHSESA